MRVGPSTPVELPTLVDVNREFGISDVGRPSVFVDSRLERFHAHDFANPREKP